MKRKKLRITAVCMMMSAGLMLSSCGIADPVNLAVTEVVQEATGFAFDEMGGGETVTLATGELLAGYDLVINLVNNAISIQTHSESTMNIVFSPPTTGEYQYPVILPGSVGRIEIADPPNNNITLGGNNRPGVLYIFLPEDTKNSMYLNTNNGAVRMIGNDNFMAMSINITVVNGMIDLRDFAAADILATSTNGTISASGLIADELELRTTNGIITLRDSEIFGDLVARTVNGGVTLENVDADMDRADVNAVNGRVTIR